MTVYHLRDIAAGNRKMIKAHEVKVIQVPQFEGLSIEKMLNFAKIYPEV